MNDRKATSNMGIDWREARQRLAATQAAIEGGWAPDPETTRHILHARALELAREVAPTAAASTRIEVVEFRLADERYAIESRFVREVQPLADLTPLPCTPAFVLGIFNLRGEVLSVIDIKRFFDLPKQGLTDLGQVLVLQSGAMRFGILADAILGTGELPLADLQPGLPTLTGVREKYLRGVTGERLIVLDAGKLLADEAIVVREQVGA